MDRHHGGAGGIPESPYEGSQNLPSFSDHQHANHDRHPYESQQQYANSSQFRSNDRLEKCENAAATARLAEIFRKIQPAEFYRRFITRGVRPDGRSLSAYRKPQVYMHLLRDCEGSASVRCGGSHYVATVKAELIDTAVSHGGLGDSKSRGCKGMQRSPGVDGIGSHDNLEQKRSSIGGIYFSVDFPRTCGIPNFGGSVGGVSCGSGVTEERVGMSHDEGISAYLSSMLRNIFNCEDVFDQNQLKLGPDDDGGGVTRQSNRDSSSETTGDSDACCRSERWDSQKLATAPQLRISSPRSSSPPLLCQSCSLYEWVLKVNITCIQFGGNVIDSVILVAASALEDCVLPGIVFDKCRERWRCVDRELILGSCRDTEKGVGDRSHLDTKVDDFDDIENEGPFFLRELDAADVAAKKADNVVLDNSSDFGGDYSLSKVKNVRSGDTINPRVSQSPCCGRDYPEGKRDFDDIHEDGERHENAKLPSTISTLKDKKQKRKRFISGGDTFPQNFCQPPLPPLSRNHRFAVKSPQHGFLVDPVEKYATARKSKMSMPGSDSIVAGDIGMMIDTLQSDGDDKKNGDSSRGRRERWCCFTPCRTISFKARPIAVSFLKLENEDENNKINANEFEKVDQNGKSWVIDPLALEEGLGSSLTFIRIKKKGIQCKEKRKSDAGDKNCNDGDCKDATRDDDCLTSWQFIRMGGFPICHFFHTAGEMKEIADDICQKIDQIVDEAKRTDQSMWR